MPMTHTERPDYSSLPDGLPSHLDSRLESQTATATAAPELSWHQSLLNLHLTKTARRRRQTSV